MTVEEYIQHHRNIRTRMRLAAYPNIEDESITVDFMIKGLEAHPKYNHLPDSWVDNENIPTTIKQIENRLKSISARQESKQSPPNHPEPASGIQHTPYRRGRGRGRGRGKNTSPYQPYWPSSPQPYYPFNPFGGQTPFNQIPYPPFPNLQPHPAPPPPQRRRRTKTEANFSQAENNEEENASLAALESQILENEHGTFVLDSGAHPTHITSPTPTMKLLKTPLPTHTATDNQTHATHAGPIQIVTNKNNKFKINAVANRNIRRNLLSVHQLAKKWGSVLFTPYMGFIINNRNTGPPLIGIATFQRGLYLLDKPDYHNSTSLSARTVPSPLRCNARHHTSPSQPQTSHNPSRSFIPASPAHKTLKMHQMHNPAHTPPTPMPTSPYRNYHNQHLIFNHIRPITLHRMAQMNLNPSLPLSISNAPPPLTCYSCVAAKKRKAPHRRATHRYEIGVAMSSDVCGPISPTSRQGNKYFLTFIDTFSRYLIVDFLSSRKNLSNRLAKILALIHSTTDHKPKLLRTDNANEYLSKDSDHVYISFSLGHSTSLPYTPQQNSIAERVNHTLVSAARASLHHSNLPPYHWEDGIRDAVYKYNRIMHSTTQHIPYTLWLGQKPSPAKMFAFGQLGSIPHITDTTKMSKLDPRGHPARYLYALDDNLIMILNLRTGKPQRIRPQDFAPYYRQRDPTATTTAVFKAFTPHRTPRRIEFTTPAPQSHGQARKYPDACEWAKAHNEELESLDANNVIKWLPDSQLPKKAKLIPLKITYRYKRNSAGHIERRKARCALRGDQMLPHVHYDPDRTTTYMADKATVRLLFAISAAYNLHLEHRDIESAYLHEKATPEPPVYVKQHPRFDGSLKHPCRAGLLTGNLYGGKEAGHIYLEAAAKYLLSLKFRQSEADPCLFHRKSSDGIIFLTINIDDYGVAATSLKLLNSFHDELQLKYRVKRMGFPSIFLGWTVSRLPNGGIHISQPATINTILVKHKLIHCNGKNTPYLDKNSLHPTTDTDTPAPLSIHSYQQLIGDLRYLADSTRPDIFFAVNRLAASASKPAARHWAAIKRLLRYLKQTSTHGKSYFRQRNPKSTDTLQRRTDTALESYSDSDHAADTTDRRSITGALHTDNGSPISWTSSKQSIHALSTCEAEYIAATTAAQQTNWLRRILADLQMLPPSPTPFYMDNQSAIQVAKNQGPTKRRKFIDLRHHYLAGQLRKKEIDISHLPSSSMLADVFTKILKPATYTKIVAKMLVHPLPNNQPTNPAEYRRRGSVTIHKT